MNGTRARSAFRRIALLAALALQLLFASTVFSQPTYSAWYEISVDHDLNANQSSETENAVVRTAEPPLSVSLESIGVHPEANQVYVTLDATTDADVSIDLFSSEGDLLGRPFQTQRIHSGEHRIGLAIP